MAIDALPTPPSVADPDNFDTRADAWNLALVTATSQINSTATQVTADAATASAAANAAASSATAYDTSTTSNTIASSGDKTFTVTAGKGFLAGMYVLAARTSAAATTWMAGRVKSYSSTTLVITMDQSAGSGSGITDWTISPASPNGLPAASASVVRTGTSTATAMTPGGTYTALESGTLTDAATVTPDFAAGINFYLLTTSGVGSTRQIANPTNPKVGQVGHIRVVQDGTGSRAVTFGSNWKRAGGATTFTTTASATDIIVYEVITTTYILYDVIKNAS